MEKFLYSLAILLLSSTQIHAQQIKVSGTVTDETGMTLVGVNVIIKSTDPQVQVGTITDFDGYYELELRSSTDTLRFSYTGYTSVDVFVQSRSVIDMTMTTSAELLDEIVVVGYGVQSKRVATGAVSKVSSEDMEGIKFQDVQSILDGQVAGLIVNESSGQPGAATSLLIRGISTNGDNSPLYIVDGMQVGGISNIAPGDIESVDVLKDAASTAIYGARAANGVVIITTKKGGEGPGSITYDGFASSSQPWKLPEMLNASQYINLTREKFKNGGQLGALDILGFPNEGDTDVNTDWMDVIFNPATVQNHRLTMSGENSFIALEYWNQDGVVGGDKSNYKRYAARINLSKQLNDIFKVGENLSITRVENNSIGVNNAFGTVIADAFAYDPITDVYDDNAQYGFAQSKWVQKEYINPLSRLFISENDGHSDQIIGNIYLDITPIKYLTFRTDLGLDYTWSRHRNFTPDYNFHSAFVNVENDVSQGSYFGQSIQWENYFKYDRSFGSHNVDLVLGMSYRNSNSEWSGGSSQSIPDGYKFDPNWQYVDAGQDSTDLAYGRGAVEYSLISYFGRVLYDYQGKYLFSATLRRDGSSNFGTNNRWGWFPSFSAGWVLSREDFFNSGFVSFLKVRGSWGINGNDRIRPLSYASTIENVFTYAFGRDQLLYTGAALATPPNPNIKWEESDQIDIGVEARFLEGKLTAEVDVYQKRTKDLLMEQFIPGYIGATNNPISNLGEIKNTGIEAALSYRWDVGDFSLTTGLNYTTFKNEVVKVAGDLGYLQGYSWPVRNTAITRMTEGFPVGHFVGYKTDGIFQSQNEIFDHINNEGDLLQPKAEPGDIRFVDVTNDGIINSDDITDIGSPWPSHIIGLSLNTKYKGFDVAMMFTAQVGKDVYRTYERSDVTYTNYQTFWLDRWTEENPGGTYPRLVSNDPNNNQRPSDFYVEDASFLRLRNLQIGYSLPSRMLEKIKLQELRIYFSANNLFTVTGYNGFDPNIGTNGWILDTGIDKGYYPSNRTLGGGIKITM